MIISDLEHMEVVAEDTSIDGGIAQVQLKISNLALSPLQSVVQVSVKNLALNNGLSIAASNLDILLQAA